MNDPILKTVWRSAEAVVQRDTLSFWREHRLIPDDANLALRLGEICIVAYDGPRIVGVHESSLVYLDRVRARIAMVRVSVAPDRRLHDLAANLVIQGKSVMEEWSRANPDEKLMGVSMVIEIKGPRRGRLQLAVTPESGHVLIGYTPRGEQIRLAWFAHATVE